MNAPECDMSCRTAFENAGMQILLLLAAVLVFCLFCGVYTSAKSVARGADHIRSELARGKSAQPVACAEVTEVHRRNQCCIDDVKNLFALYQGGALTREEFEEAKRRLLAGLTASA